MSSLHVIKVDEQGRLVTEDERMFVIDGVRRPVKGDFRLEAGNLGEPIIHPVHSEPPSGTSRVVLKEVFPPLFPLRINCPVNMLHVEDDGPERGLIFTTTNSDSNVGKDAHLTPEDVALLHRRLGQWLKRMNN